jgi:hypothetical protein
MVYWYIEKYGILIKKIISLNERQAYFLYDSYTKSFIYAYTVGSTKRIQIVREILNIDGYAEYYMLSENSLFNTNSRKDRFSCWGGDVFSRLLIKANRFKNGYIRVLRR